MGEIKSTLELVLEKTRHLSLSEEEKRENKRKEARDKLTGLLQRYQDSKVDSQKMTEELDGLLQTDNTVDESTICDEIMGRIELGYENGPWLELLQTRYRIDPSGLQAVEKDFLLAIEAAAGRRIEEMKAELDRARRISGSAVVPNLDADPAWIEVRRSIVADFQHLLAAEIDRLKSAPV